MSTIPKFRILRNSNQGYRLPYELLDLIENEIIKSEEYLQQQKTLWVMTFMGWYHRSKRRNGIYLKSDPYPNYLIKTEQNIMRDDHMAYAMAQLAMLDNPIKNTLHKTFTEFHNLIINLIDISRYDIINILLNNEIVKNTFIQYTENDIENIKKFIINKVINNKITNDNINQLLDDLEDNERYYEIILNVLGSNLNINTNHKDTIQLSVLIYPMSGVADFVELKLIQNNKIKELKKLLSFKRVRKRLYDELKILATKYKKDIQDDLESDEVFDDFLVYVQNIHKNLRNNSQEYSNEFPQDL